MKWYHSRPANEVSCIPFLHPVVISYLDKVIQKTWNILEHGSGGSTLWMATRCNSVMSIENNPNWLEAVQKRAGENVTIATMINPLLQYHAYDIILIDGEPVTDRARWIESAVDMIAPGGLIVLDNANRPEYADQREWLRLKCAEYFTNNGNEENTKYLVTDFFWMKK